MGTFVFLYYYSGWQFNRLRTLGKLFVMRFAGFYCVIYRLGTRLIPHFSILLTFSFFLLLLLILWCVLRKLNALCISAPNHSSNLVRAFCIDTDIWFRNKCQKCRNMNCCFIAIILVVAMRQMNWCVSKQKQFETNQRKDRLRFWSMYLHKPFAKNNGLLDKQYLMSRKN